MASQLRVDEIIASTGSSVAIGTAGGSVTLAGDFTVDTSKGLNVGTGATIFSPSSNVLTLGTNSVERVRIDSSGRIGVGTDTTTTNYGKVINVHNSGGAGSSLHLTDKFSGNTNSDGFELVYHTNDAYLVQRENANIIFMTNGTNERLRITSSGNVGIGTDNPQGKLVVSNGSAGLEFNPNSGQAIVSYNRITSAYTPIGLQGSTVGLYIGGVGEALRINSSGYVGIGTDNPGYKLDVRPTPSDPTSGSPPAGAFVQIRADDATVGNGPSLALLNLGGTKETAWRISAVSTSGNNGDLVFNGYAGGATYPEIARFLSGGGITFNGDTAATNALDDYEEGNVTMTATVSSGTLTVTGQSVRYTKIGRLVTVTGFFQTYSSSASGNVTFGGLPYASVNLTTGGGGGTCQVWKYNGGNPTEVYPCNIHVTQNSTTFEMYFKNSSGNAEKIEAADMNGFGNIGQVYSFNLSYIVS